MATLQTPLSFNNNSGNQPVIPQNTDNVDTTPVKSFINPGFFTGGSTNMIDDVVGAENFEAPKKRGRGRPPPAVRIKNLRTVKTSQYLMMEVH